MKLNKHLILEASSLIANIKGVPTELPMSTKERLRGILRSDPDKEKSVRSYVPRTVQEHSPKFLHKENIHPRPLREHNNTQRLQNTYKGNNYGSNNMAIMG